MELITITNNIAILDAETARNIAEFERAIKTIKEQEGRWWGPSRRAMRPWRSRRMFHTAYAV